MELSQGTNMRRAYYPNLLVVERRFCVSRNDRCHGILSYLTTRINILRYDIFTKIVWLTPALRIIFSSYFLGLGQKNTQIWDQTIR